MSKPKLAMKVFRTPIGIVLRPADTYTKGWALEQSEDSLLWVTTHKPRSPKFHRAVHALCTVLSDNVDKFSGMQSHNVLKTLQLEAQLYCDAMALDVPGYGRVMHLIPQSISFDAMDEAEFRPFIDRLADHVRETYWPEFGLHLLDQREEA